MSSANSFRLEVSKIFVWEGLKRKKTDLQGTDTLNASNYRKIWRTKVRKFLTMIGEY